MSMVDTSKKDIVRENTPVQSGVLIPGHDTIAGKILRYVRILGSMVERFFKKILSLLLWLFRLNGINVAEVAHNFANANGSTGTIDREKILARLVAHGMKKAGSLAEGTTNVGEKFLNATARMAAFINKQEPEIQKKIFTALASSNCGVAMSILLHATQVGTPVSGKFFDDLSRSLLPDYSNVFLNAEQLIQSQKNTNVNSAWGNEHRIKEEIITFLESEKIGQDLFTAGKFESKLDAVAQKIGQLVFFADLPRSFQMLEIIIGGQAIDCEGCPRGSREDAAKFFLKNLQASELPPDVAFNALKSLCYYNWTQGECMRPVIAFLEMLPQEKRNAVNYTILKNFYNPYHKTKIEFFNTGTIEISSTFTVDSTTVCDGFEEAAVCLKEIRSQINPEESFITAFTSIECDSDGKHRILDSMLACQVAPGSAPKDS
ncbi:MAG: hypothetical protein LBI34_02350 [Puniceicoccales bacterium]|nr:hypothetical protein [Puniceicoccales bacterium]